MAAFQNTPKQMEKKAMVHFLTEIEKNPSFKQRGLVSKFGITLRLINQYLKNCITKRWLRAPQISPKRITYFLASEEFKEKSGMMGQYLIRSLTFFRNVRKQCEEVFAQCKGQNWYFMKSWFVAHTHSMKKQLAEQHLREQDFDVYLPHLKKTRQLARKVEKVSQLSCYRFQKGKENNYE